MQEQAAMWKSNAEFLSGLIENLAALNTVTSNKQETFFNIPAGFDIETSSFYNEKDLKTAIMYEWTFGIGWVADGSFQTMITYGRTWRQFEVFLDAVALILDLNPVNRRLVVYIHNFPYEWQFIRKRFNWNKVFFLDERKPVYAIADNGIEFRCSLKLSGKSLANTAKDLTKYQAEKMVGDLDYNLIRHPETPLTATELGYCYNDVKVILCYIMEKIEQEGDITRIPLTKTGYVRRYCKAAMFQGKGNYTMSRTLMKNLTLNPEEYQQLKEAFQGGFTHANAHRVGIVHTQVGSYDFTSSYPASMVAFKYPMSKGEYIGDITKEQLVTLCKTHCCMFRVRITNLVPLKHIEHPLSSSKCRNKRGVVEDNGRVVTAEYLETTITEQDYFILEEFYDWEDLQFFDCWAYQKAYLPTPFVRSILELYQDKTTLKGVEGQEVNYLLKKEMQNSCYGMTVTDLVRENLEFSELNETGCTSNYDRLENETKEEYEKRMDKYLRDQVDRYNKNPYRFLFYPWGVWVTAYSRANLFSGILEADRDYVYSDTDSIKITNPHDHEEYIERYNRDMAERMKIACEHHGIDYSMTHPKNIKGEEKPLGAWEFEGVYDEFKTLGAKRYLARTGNKWLFTVAGVNKVMAKNYLIKRTHEINRVLKKRGKKPQSPFHLFNIDLVIPKEWSGRTVVTYIDEPTNGVVIDYQGNSYKYEELSAIHMEATDYSLNPIDAFINYLFTIREEMW